MEKGLLLLEVGLGVCEEAGAGSVFERGFGSLKAEMGQLLITR